MWEEMRMFQVVHISKYYDRFRLEDISLEIPKGYIVGVLGENGAGKSVLLKILLGYVKPDQGSLFMNGKNLWESGEVQREIKNEQIGRASCRERV